MTALIGFITLSWASKTLILLLNESSQKLMLYFGPKWKHVNIELLSLSIKYTILAG